eukprot:CAMPEP_0197022856 /NCGR_PEP_ID=MMETSP1384-20130603/3659_1 /TAXON_ID=29189 /ORGANISM="Ammonia sp." /LENGTH=352 /DNA_ID=CAMNT_0042450967 /DNA_START=24 /DNA_END=1082 /DNA_ORIENTATION=+
MSDWDNSDEEPVKPQAAKPANAATKVPDDWEDSSEEEQEAVAPPASTNATQPTANKTADWDDTDESDNEKNTPAANDNATSNQNGNAQPEAPTAALTEEQKRQNDEEALKALQKKMLQQKGKKKKSKRGTRGRKKNKDKEKESNAVPKQQDEVIEMSSEDSSDSDSDSNKHKKQGQKQKKMQTYDDRMKTDNDILFQGHDAAKRQKKEAAPPAKKVDTRPMLSGEVTLKNFPLGSGRDCENLADQVSGILDQKLYEEQITTEDVFLFYKKILASNLLDHLDMVETKELTTKMNSLLKLKQKNFQIKKNPKGKKKKKAQWLVSNKFNQQQTKKAKAGHVAGQYDKDEFDAFDL